jgi:hypothetical protein
MTPKFICVSGEINASQIIITGSLGYTVRSLALVMTRRLWRLTWMSIAFGMDGTRTSRGNIAHTMAESKKSEVRILFATMDIIAGRIRFPPTQMQIVLHLRGTSQQTSKASERTWSALLAFWRSDGGCWTMDFIIATLTLARRFLWHAAAWTTSWLTWWRGPTLGLVGEFRLAVMAFG